MHSIDSPDDYQPGNLPLTQAAESKGFLGNVAVMAVKCLFYICHACYRYVYPTSCSYAAESAHGDRTGPVVEAADSHMYAL